MDASTEWEYEYDANETEDLYLTLDLTTHAPEAVPVQNVLRNGRRVPKDPATSRLPVNGDVPGGDGDDTLEPPAGTLQVLDLHTEEPLIKFDKGAFSCRWHTDLGTQFFVTKPGAVSNPKRAGRVLDIVGTSQTRLLGHAVKLRQRADWVDDTAAGVAGGCAGSVTAAELPPSDLTRLRPGEQVVISRKSVKTPEQATQASFFERLSAIKLQKGEHDIIPISGVRHYKTPANKDEIRERALAVAAAAAAEAPVPITQPSSPVRKRKRTTFADMGLETKAVKAKRLKAEAVVNGTWPYKRVPRLATQSRPPAQQGADAREASADLPTTGTVAYAIPPTYPDPIREAGEASLPSSLPWDDIPSTIETAVMTAPATRVHSSSSEANRPQTPIPDS
ncbi:hypothetical protein LTR53_011859 [Teratosphaeriaceae sp. CCFEE 6253]|nr:hypothetical protein LTR53_011859 [Teratosphaeriaceae sp. CCFEE 6253]